MTLKQNLIFKNVRMCHMTLIPLLSAKVNMEITPEQKE